MEVKDCSNRKAESYNLEPNTRGHGPEIQAEYTPTYIFNPGNSSMKLYSNRTKIVINEDLFIRNVR